MQLLSPHSAIYSTLAFAVVRLNDSGPCAFAGIARVEDGDGFNADLKCAAHAGDI